MVEQVVPWAEGDGLSKIVKPTISYIILCTQLGKIITYTMKTYSDSFEVLWEI
jgi:hypothetical protein